VSLSSLPLSYCTNVHPGQSVAEVERGLNEYTVPVKSNFGTLAAGLWLASPVIHELQSSSRARRAFADGLAKRGLSCHTLNAFPFGNFHSRRVKENVYVPDWTTSERLEYTHACARMLAELLPEGAEGSISTVPLGFKLFDHAADFGSRCVSNLLEFARRLHRLHLDSGRLIRLAIEPEPCCVVETTSEAIVFFEQLWQAAGAETGAGNAHLLDIARRHLGVCYDVCHQAVEFEDVPGSIRALDAAGVRINKVHITCALQLEAPATNREGREALARYVEERYLHQTFARRPNGDVVRQVDLSESLAHHPPPEFRDAERWRVHFHVPVDADSLGPLGTTRTDLKQALATVAELDYAPHLEVETYTWQVLPNGRRPTGAAHLVDGLTRELVATRMLLENR
jgi:sugar phosphate isomerase/epimerase